MNAERNVKIPDKLKYTSGEKTAEAASLALAFAYAVLSIVMFALGALDGSVVIMVLVSLILCGAFTICSVYPQWTNIMYTPEKCTEKAFHRIRRNCIIAKLTFTAAFAAGTVIICIVK